MESKSDNLTVKFNFAPICFQLSQDGILSGQIWYRYIWHDLRLTYDPEDYGGIKLIRVSPTRVWVPDVVLYNSYVDGSRPQFLDRSNAPHVLIYPDGEILWVPEAFIAARFVNNNCKVASHK